MKEGWKYKSIDELCDKFNGLWKGKKPPFVNVGVIRNANFTKDFTLCYDNVEYLDVEAKQYSKRKLQKGDLIVEKSGGSDKQPVGRAVLFLKNEGEYSFSNFTSVLRIKDANEMSYEFLYKYLLYIYNRGEMRSMQQATTGIHNIEFDKYLKIQVPILLLTEQQRIVDYLDSAFAKIDALKAKTKENLDNAHALFQAALKEMMTPKEGWEEKMLKDIGLIQTGTTPSKNDPNNYGDFLPFVRPSEIDFDDMGHINPVCEISLSKQGANIGRRISANSVLMVCIGTIGKVGYCETEVSCNQQINVITPYEEYDQLFVYYAMSSRNFKKKVVTEGTSAQATLPIINKSKWEQLLLSVPPKEEQIKVARALIELQRKVISMRQIFEKISAECDALKQSLLRQIFE
jgi:type I restriction enzyme S subunit